MSIETWGMMPKNQEDAETIEEAINRIVADHMADPDAHLGEGEALQSHRASEIIDHLALSIVEDKIESFQVTLDKVTVDKQYIRTNFEVESLLEFTGTGSHNLDISGLVLTTTNINNAYENVYVPSETAPVNFLSKSPVIEVVFKVPYVTNCLAYVGCGLYGYDFVVIEIDNGVAYAVIWDLQTKTRTQITIPNMTEKHSLRIVAQSADRFYWFIDNELVYSQESDLLLADEENGVLDARVQTKSAAYRYMYLYTLKFFQDL